MYDPDLSRKTRPELPGHKKLQLIRREDALHVRIPYVSFGGILCLVRLSHSRH